MCSLKMLWIIKIKDVDDSVLNDVTVCAIWDFVKTNDVISRVELMTVTVHTYILLGLSSSSVHPETVQ